MDEVDDVSYKRGGERDDCLLPSEGSRCRKGAERAERGKEEEGEGREVEKA